MKIFEFLKDLWNWIVEQFQKIDEDLKAIGTIAVNVVEALKEFVESDKAALITELIPGDVDDKIRAFLLDIIPEALSTSALIRDSGSMTPDEAIVAWIKKASELDHDTVSGEYLSVAAKIVKKLALYMKDGKLSITEAMGLAYSIFNGFVKKPSS